MSERLIVFTRYPEPGTTKTRLIPALGPEGAADLHRQMAEHSLVQARRLQEQRPVALEVRFDGGSEERMRAWLGADVACVPQGEGDLGERMARAFREAFWHGVERIVIVGTDCPALTADLMSAALAALGDHDLVLGPATDGGYTLIGLRRELPQLFAGVPWGTGKVLERTLAIAEQAQLRVRLLERLDDVDRPEDLPAWERVTQSRAARARLERISIIIPALDEAANIEAAIASAQAAPGVEIIVADGGSSDGTPGLAAAHGAKVITSPAGRARQMNAGAEAATGDILLFLHADTRLPHGYDAHVREALALPRAIAGAFAFRVDARLRRLRLIEWLANFRSRRLHMPYGDQGIFLRAETFHELGGFPDQPIMEDFELMRRLKRRGRIVNVPEPAVTSARRWLRIGTFRTTMINQVAIVAYWLGVSPARIARWYHRESGVPDPETCS